MSENATHEHRQRLLAIPGRRKRVVGERDVTDCRVISSELGDAELERKIVARVKLFKFEARDVETITARKTIEFFPA